MIYLDNAATTCVFDSAAKAAHTTMLDAFYNPNATYKSAVSANDNIEANRRIIADAIGAYPDELVFTSCATEANNTVFSCGIKNQKGNIVITAGEHSSVYECAMQLKNKGRDVRIAPLNPDGTVSEEKLLQLVDTNTALVSIIHVNNETGVINPIKRISIAVRERAPRVFVHSDGVQGVLKLNQPICDLDVDYYSISAHKIGAPKGIGLLYIRRGLNIAPLLFGGGQESGRRSGTQNTPYIAAFSAATEEFLKRADTNRIYKIRNELCNYFSEHGCKIIGGNNASGYILCVCIPEVKAEILQNLAYDRGVIIGKGAACSGSKRGNRVLEAMGLSKTDAECCIRISTFVDTTIDDAISAAKIILECATTIRSEHVK